MEDTISQPPFWGKKISLTIANVSEDMKPWKLLFWLNNTAQFILLCIDSREILGYIYIYDYPKQQCS